MANNIIQAVLDYRYVDTRSVWQYDYGQILRIQGENLPKAVEVHFSLNEVGGDSITKIGVTTDGITEVQVPDELLENGGARFKYNIYAFVYTEDGASGNTEYRVRIPVQVRPKPSDHVTPDNTDIDPFGDVVKAVNNAAERAEASEQKAKEHAASASKSAVTTEKTKEDALRKVGEKKREAIEAIQNQEETSVGKITTHTDGEIQRIQNQATDSKAGLEQTITNAGVSKEELDESIQTASDTKTALDKSVELAGTAKTELDTSIREAGTAKIALDESTETAGTVQETLSATVNQAGTLDTSIGEKIETGTQLKTDLIASGEKAVQDIQTAGSEQLGKMQAVAEAFTADREQIATNKKDIGSLKEDLSNKITKFYASNQGETHLADSDNGKIMDMMLYGRSEQKQYRGKNLLKIRDGTQATRGVTVTAKDGVVALKGTATETGWAIFDIDSFALDGTCIISSNTTAVRVTLANKSYKQVLEQNKSNTLENAEASKVCFTVAEGKTYDISNILVQIEKGSKATSYEPYVGGQPSPSPDYPQEIKSVVNPIVKLSNEDGTQFETVTFPYTLNAIPVASGGNVTIDGQQYIADYVDVEQGKVIRNILKWHLADIKTGFNNNTRWHMNISRLGIDGSKEGLSNMFKIQSSRYNTVTISELHTDYSGKFAALNMRGMTDEEFKKWIIEKNPEIYNVLTVAEEIPITLEEASAFKQLMTYYPVTNISVNSEQLEGYTVFNYPISMANGWNYVKQQLGDTRDYIYDMDAKTQDIDIQSAEAYVNSEYAVALTELEVM